MPFAHIKKFLRSKREKKKEFVKEMSLPLRNPLIGIFLDNEIEKKEEDILKELLNGLNELDVSVVILADTNLGAFSDFMVLPYDRQNRENLLYASDIALSFSFSDVEEMLFHGTIPVTMERDEIRDYNPNNETGNGFIFKKTSPWSIFAALVRAVETFKFPYDWRHIVRQGIESVGKEKND